MSDKDLSKKVYVVLCTGVLNKRHRYTMGGGEKYSTVNERQKSNGRGKEACVEQAVTKK